MNVLEKNYKELVKHLGSTLQRLNGKNSRKSKAILYSIYNKHKEYLDKIEKTKNLLEGKSPNDIFDPIEEKYEFLKHIIDGFTVTDSEGTLIESLNRCCLLTSRGEVLMDYYDMKGAVESIGGDVTIHATIDELLYFFKENEVL